MSVVVQNLGQFLLYAVIAVFVQNTVFTRGFGVSRLTKLVGDSAVDTINFCILLCLIQVLGTPLGYLADRLLMQPQVWYRDYIRPLCFTVCILLAFVVVIIFIFLLNPPNRRELLAVLPMASLNTSVLGPMLIAFSQGFSFIQTMGFALGSGLGYTFAVLIVTEGQRKMNARTVPATFRGLPINLLYIGILALAIYGLTGHMLSF
jgi:Na+-translocating ferredoxin:NAD+ oxidoreductase RnfA subunit